MEKCHRLNDYAYFIAAIRKYHNMDYLLVDAVNLAVDECKEHIIAKLELRFELEAKDARNYYERYIKEA